MPSIHARLAPVAALPPPPEPENSAPWLGSPDRPFPNKPQVKARFGASPRHPIILLGTPVRVAEWQTR